MEEKIKRLAKWSDGKKAPPVTLELNVTNKCNLKCLSCWQRGVQVNHENELTKENWINIVREGGKIGVKEIRIPGSGEPLMRKDVVSAVIKETKKFGMKGLLITNGTLFDSDLIKMLIKVEWDNVTFSIDGPDIKTNDYLRGVAGAFKKSVNGIKEFNAYKKKLKKSKPLLRLNVVLSNKNYNKLYQMMMLSQEIGCEAVSVQPMSVFSSLGSHLKLSKEQIEKLPRHIKRAKKIADKYKIYTNVDSFIKTDAVEKSNEMDELIETEIKYVRNNFLSVPCFEPWYNMIIMPNGDVGPCSVFGGASCTNIRNNSLEKVWYGDYLNKIRQNLLNKKLFKFCKNCCVPVFEENKRIRKELLKVV